MKLTRKIKEVGLINTIKGTCRRSYYNKLQKKYDFDTWHISPYELREYAQVVVKYINEQAPIENEIVDIGCGLGEVIRNVNAPKKFGFDLSPAAIEVANLLDKKNSVTYSVGTFNEVGSGRTIDYLVTLGFMQGSKEDKWVDDYTNITTNNDIKNVIVDVLPFSEEQKTNNLDFTKILPSNYKLKERKGPYLSGRYIEIYSKVN